MRLLFFSPLNKKLLNIIHHPSSKSPSLFTQKITTNYPLRKEASALTNPSSSSKKPISHISHTTQPQHQRPSLQNQFLSFKFKNILHHTQNSSTQPVSPNVPKINLFEHSLTHSLTHYTFPLPSPHKLLLLTNQCISTYLQYLIGGIHLSAITSKNLF